MSASRITGAAGCAAGPVSRGRIGPADRRVQQIGDRIDPIDRRLHRDRVVHVVLRVEEEIRRHQHARRQRRQHVVGDIALRDVQLGGAQPVHVDLQRRIVQHLHQMRVGHAGNPAHALQQLAGQAAVARSKFTSWICTSIGADRPKFSTWLNDVGGLEIEDAAGELVRQPGADGADVVDRRTVTRLERDQDLRVHRADIVGRHERQVERGRHADRVVDGVQLVRGNDLADAVLDLQHQLLGALEPRAGRGAVVQLDQADIGGGEEVEADHAWPARSDTTSSAPAQSSTNTRRCSAPSSSRP